MEDQGRRSFLKVAGLAAVGAVGGSTVVAWARSQQQKTGRKQWAMVIDVKACLREEGCTKCIEACHRTHNVPDVSQPRYGVKPEDVKLRELKWIWKEPYEGVFPDQQHEFTARDLAGVPVTILCNHCERPPCVRVCPTQATWKRESDGIVMMDMHRCIGCRYCMVGCPYGSRSFNWMTPWPRPFGDHSPAPPNKNYPTRMKGVVEKCTFCSERLVQAERRGEHSYTPVCVEVCPAKAMHFGDVGDDKSEIVDLLERVHSIVRKPALGTGPQVYYIV
jgi:molybdopterin-containing oxidoreductase family iron-sulfur binding subunit